jgi:stress response protein SCP2
MTNLITAQLLQKTQQVMLEKRHLVIGEFVGSEITSKVGESARSALTLQANLEAYGYSFSTDLLKALSNCSEENLVNFNEWFMPSLLTSLGAHRMYAPMYPNFPKQVMEASSAELIINAIMHYTGDVVGLRIMPHYGKKARAPLDAMPKNVPQEFLDVAKGVEPLQMVKLGSVEAVKELFVALINSNTSLSESDKEHVAVLFSYFHATNEIGEVLSTSQIAQKETLSYIGKLVIENGLDLSVVSGLFQTSTDILRVVVALSDWDISLAAPTKFIKFGRPVRRAILSLLESVIANGQEELVMENMYQYRDQWVRVGERLHPGEYVSRFPLSVKLFTALRNETAPTNFYGQVDIAIDNRKFDEAIDLLKTRPGVFARTLNRLFQRIEGNNAQPLVRIVAETPKFANMFTGQKAEVAPPNNPFAVLKDKVKTVVKAVEEKVEELVTPTLSDKDKEVLLSKAIAGFAQVASKVSTPVLLQVYNHFKTQGEKTHRIFLPKGSVAKAFIAENNVEALSQKIANDIVFVCRDALVERFKALPSLGKVYIDPQLEDQNVPFAMRSASKALKTVARGSKIYIGQDAKDTTRFFIWWHEHKSESPDSYYNDKRVDIDLAVVFLNSEFKYVDHCSFTNLRGQGFAHSGDITSAPNGACEFIDINKSELNPNIQYAVMMVNSYTNQPYYELPECFAGWMERDKPQTGEIYEPRTVKNKFDLTSDSQSVLPMIIDVKNNKAIWADLSLNNSNWWNMIEYQNAALENMVKSMVYISKPKLSDLFEMHAQARGEVVTNMKDADTVFSMHEGITPYDYEKIASEFMADKVEEVKPKKKM